MQIVIGYKGLVGDAIFGHLNKLNEGILGLGRIDYKLNDLTSDYAEGSSMLDLLDEFVSNNDVQNIFYCAGSIVPREERFIVNEIQDEIVRISKIAQMCKRENIRLIYFSTAGAMYSVLGPYQEDSEIANHYKALKLLSESILVSYGIDHLIIRLSNVYGRYWIKKSNGVIDYIVRCIKNRTEINLYGSLVKFDFVHRDDIAAITMILLNDNISGVVNLGSGHSYSIYDLYQFVKNNFKEVAVTYNYKKSDLLGSTPAVEKMQKTLLDNGHEFSFLNVKDYIFNSPQFIL